MSNGARPPNGHYMYCTACSAGSSGRGSSFEAGMMRSLALLSGLSLLLQLPHIKAAGAAQASGSASSSVARRELREGSFAFTNVAADSGVNDTAGITTRRGRGVTLGDLDGDNDLDILVANLVKDGGAKNLLYQNDGDLSFRGGGEMFDVEFLSHMQEDVSRSSLSPEEQAAWRQMQDLDRLPSSETAHTQHGPVTGVRKTKMGLYKKLPQPVDAWYGIRFAPQPERFRPPVPLTDDFVHDPVARKHAPICMQPATLRPRKVDGSEDCLFLDIEAPAGAKDLPVLFWIYGGGYQIGDSWEYGVYNAAALASQRNMVVVKVNYRVGALGFWASDYLRDTDPGQTTGNQALLDQRMAMVWVQNNIAAFGGDPKRVTLAGESAGSFSVNWHMSSPASFPLYQQAITESGANKMSLFFQDYNNATAFYSNLGTLLGCTGSDAQIDACLRKLRPKKFIMTITELLAVSARRHLHPPYAPPRRLGVPDWASPLWPVMPFGPVIDGSKEGLAGDPHDIMMQGKAAKVPLIVGSNHDDGSMFADALPLVVPDAILPVTEKKFPHYLDWIFQNATAVEKLLQAYPEEDFKTGGLVDTHTRRISRMIRDMIFMCGNRRYFQNWEAKSGHPVWTYVFSQPLGAITHLSKLGTFHAADLFFLFETYYWLPHLMPLFKMEDARRAATAFQCYWANFIHNGDPAKVIPECEEEMEKYEFPTWTPYEGGSRPGGYDEASSYLSLKSEPRMRPVPGVATERFPYDEIPGSGRCDFFDQHAPQWHKLRDDHATRSAPGAAEST